MDTDAFQRCLSAFAFFARSLRVHPWRSSSHAVAASVCGLAKTWRAGGPFAHGAAPVGIPSKEGAEVQPLSPQQRLSVKRTITDEERLRIIEHAIDEAVDHDLAVVKPAPVLPPQPLDPNTVRLRPKAKRKAKRLDPTPPPVEMHWYECLLYPIKVWPWLAVLGVAWPVLGMVFMLAMPIITEGGPDGAILLGLLLLLAVPVFAFVSAFAQCVLDSGMAGETRRLLVPGKDPRLFLQSAVTCLLCILAGPIVSAWAAFAYWLNCGDPNVLDIVILTELLFVAIWYALFAFLSVRERGRLGDLHPLRVLSMIHRLGYQGVIIAFAASCILMIHLGTALVAFTIMHKQVMAGGVLGLSTGITGLICLAFVLRWLGVAYLWDKAATLLQPEAEVENMEVE